MREYLKKNAQIIVGQGAFFLPFLSCLLICAANRVYPFGDRCILHVDMYHQYCPFFTEFLDKLRSGGNMMYSWTAGLGSDFIALYAYYLASPLNWLIVLCPRGLVIEFMTLMILVKIGLCGLGFFQFLQYKKGSRFSAGQGIAALVFSTGYAMSGFVAAYSWDIMWMDCVALLPFIALGLLRLVREKKPAVYFATLALAIFANYYLALMICIFLCFYFLLVMAEEKGGWRDVLRFAGYSLLAGGCSAVLLIPELSILSFSGSSGIEKPEFRWYFNILQELARVSVTAEPYTANDHWPNLYTGAFSLVLVVLYVLNRRISWKKKLPRLFMLAFFLVSFANSWLDFFWHGLHFPNSLPGRQAFLYAFVVLAMAHEAAIHREGSKLWHPAAALLVWMGLLAAGYYQTQEDIVDSVSIVITGILVICYCMFAFMLHVGKERERRYLRVLACVLAVSELVLNMAVTGFSTTSRSQYVELSEDYARLLGQVRLQDDDLFYRIEDTQRKTKSDSGLYDYPSVTQFSSLMNINVSHFYQRMYMEGGKNFYCYNGETPLLSALLSVKYRFSDNPNEDGPLMQRAAEAGGRYLYRNTYSLPFGILLSEDLEEAWKAGRGKIANLNDLGYRLGAAEDIIGEAPVSCREEEGITTISVREDGYYYAASQGNSSDSLVVNNSTRYSKKYSKTTHTYLIGLGYLYAGESATITNTGNETIAFDVYKLNLAAVDQAYKTLSAQTMELTEFSDTRIRGKIHVDQPGRLFFSMPNEGGWTLYVNGKKTPVRDFAETFVSVSLEKGDYTIELTYVTPGLIPGACISIVCLLLFAAATYFRSRTGGKNQKNDEEWEAKDQSD